MGDAVHYSFDSSIVASRSLRAARLQIRQNEPTAARAERSRGAILAGLPPCSANHQKCQNEPNVNLGKPMCDFVQNVAGTPPPLHSRAPLRLSTIPSPFGVSAKRTQFYRKAFIHRHLRSQKLPFRSP